MCGRYELNDDGKLDGYFSGAKIVKVKPNFNVAPTQIMPVFAEGELQQMKWGIHRQIGPKIEKDIINTRADKAMSRFWGKAVREFRCLIPATGFYEWKITDGSKQPYFIHPKGRELYCFAGIYAIDKEGNYSYSIMTTEPNREMKEIHNRMPVILEKTEEDEWLNADSDDALVELLMPYKDDGLEMHKVSSAVNSVKKNYAELSEETG